ncbi:MAG: sulfopyruvate decarboxylase subunit alpha, partial [candidate division NC10 bacterium]|nr:sulfopyruvate decarboxylase subunit alpha [candidate division NC10 bacterium]
MDWSGVLYTLLRQAGIRYFVHVPDTPLSRLITLAGADTEAILLPATREEEGVGIAAGVHLGGGRAALLMQTSGLGNTLNALGSLAVPYQIPFLMVISLRGEPGEWNAAQVP